MCIFASKFVRDEKTRLFVALPALDSRNFLQENKILPLHDDPERGSH
jgi:hypothetical protein